MSQEIDRLGQGLTGRGNFNSTVGLLGALPARADTWANISKQSTTIEREAN